MICVYMIYDTTSYCRVGELWNMHGPSSISCVGICAAGTDIQILGNTSQVKICIWSVADLCIVTCSTCAKGCPIFYYS